MWPVNGCPRVQIRVISRRAPALHPLRPGRCNGTAQPVLQALPVAVTHRVGHTSTFMPQTMKVAPDAETAAHVARLVRELRTVR